jgi:hypothetical protein
MNRRLVRGLTSGIAAFGLFPFCQSVFPGLLSAGAMRVGMSLWAAQALALLCLLVDAGVYRRP